MFIRARSTHKFRHQRHYYCAGSNIHGHCFDNFDIHLWMITTVIIMRRAIIISAAGFAIKKCT